GGNQESAENCVHAADHLQVIFAVATVPLPPRRPDEAERVDREEDCAECNQGNLEQFFACKLVHVPLLSASVRGLLRYRGSSGVRTNDPSSMSHARSSKSVEQTPPRARLVDALMTDCTGLL